VLLAAEGGERDVVRGFALGADDYILKPFSPAELAARLTRLTRD
jgi:DNA-binding response OmpR family regulator